MNKLVEAYVLEDDLIQRLIKIARKNWDAWHDVFQHVGRIADNPVLACPTTFASFLKEYYVNRTIWKTRHDDLRRKLRNSRRFHKAIEDGSGRALDRLEQHLRPPFRKQKRQEPNHLGVVEGGSIRKARAVRGLGPFCQGGAKHRSRSERFFRIRDLF